MNQSLITDIKFNCDVSDAQYWGHFSVCGLLLRYRDLYRSEQGLKPWAIIDRKKIGEWIGAKEARWPEMETQRFRNLTINGKSYDPYDVAGINHALEKHQLVYGAGIGMYMKPTFFLAQLRSVRTIQGLIVFSSGRELVRDLLTAPGMLQDRNVFLRQEPLVILLLYKHSELNTRQAKNLEDAFARYGFSGRRLIDSTFEEKLEEMADKYAEVLLRHELAEAAEDVPEWKEILILAEDRKVELYLRAIKDLLADTSDCGPYRLIIENRDLGALGLSIALMEGFRKKLYPGIREAFEALTAHTDWTVMERARQAGYARFRKERDEIVMAYREAKGTARFMTALRERVRGI